MLAEASQFLPCPLTFLLLHTSPDSPVLCQGALGGPGCAVECHCGVLTSFPPAPGLHVPAIFLYCTQHGWCLPWPVLGGGGLALGEGLVRACILRAKKNLPDGQNVQTMIVLIKTVIMMTTELLCGAFAGGGGGGRGMEAGERLWAIRTVVEGRISHHALLLSSVFV